MNTILQLGHLGLLDSVPLLVAQKHGFFTAAGLQVELSCELGLASLTARLAEDRLAGACLPAPLPLLLSLGLGRTRVSLENVLVVSYQNLAITLPRLRDPRSRPLRLGVLGNASPSRFVLQRWLELSGRLPTNDVAIVPVAVSQLLAFLADGLIDGFCAEEPLPALAAGGESSMDVTSSGTVLPMHPGSVVVLRTNVVRHHPELRAALADALQRACHYCAEPSHQDELWSLLRAQAPLAFLHAQGRRLDEPASGSLPDTLPPSNVRHVTATHPGGVDAAGAHFLEQACRAMAGSSGRGTDFRAEVARFYGSSN